MGRVGIVLAVYNGDAFLQAQLESIYQQDYQDWVLYIRDDCSDDHSRKIIERFAQKDSRTYVLTDGNGNLGAKQNFSSLIEARELSSFDYIVFADQDDVWQQDKLSLQLDLMQKTEGEFPGKPVLIHSNMHVVDQFLATIDESFMEYLGIHHEAIHPLHVLLSQNFVTGCTVMVNRQLLDTALPMPEEAAMHDWWLALCAAVYGEIEYIDQPLVKYRQHDSNTVGAKGVRDLVNPFRVAWLKFWLNGRTNLLQSLRQARVLAERIKERDPGNENLPLIESYASLLEMPRWSRLRRLNKNNIHCQSRLRHFLMLLRLLSLPKMDV